jgi:large subunit ribosomal protein L23
MIRSAHRTVVRALITEKGTIAREKHNCYVFKVDVAANKIEIRKAIESIFNVHVKEVRTMNVPGKEKRMGKHAGYRPDWKKAIVTIQAGENIELFEQI